jgi:hypothetical protein
MGDIERCECCEQPLTAEGQAHAQEVVMRLRAEANAGTIRDLQQQLEGAVEALRKLRDKARLADKGSGGAMAASWVEHVADDVLTDLGGQ